MATKKTGKAAGGLRGLRSSASATTSKKSSVPTVKGPEDLQNAIAQWKEGKNMEKEGKSLRLVAEGELLEPVAELRLKQCREDRKLHASINVHAGSESLKAIQAARFLKMGAEEAEPKLQAIFGTDFSRLFTTTEGISVSDEITPELETKLSGLLTKHFTADEIELMLCFDPQVKPTEQFVHQSIFDKKIRRLAEQAREDGLCQPIKLSFRL